MKRKIIALCLIVAMLGVAVISGTMAYFTDTAEAVNVMTIGSVKIEQIEQQRAEDGKTLVDFVQGKQLVPAVGSINTYIDLEGKETDSYNSAYKFLATKDAASGNLKPLANAIDKIVSVENTGRSDAYVRTIFAFEVVEAVSEVEGVDADKTIKFMRNDGKNTDTDDTTPGNSDWTWEWHDQVITVNDQKYALAVVTHEAVLAPKATTIPSLLQIYMKSNVGQEYAAKLGDTYDVLAISQAVQASGFDSAAAALNEAFGAPTGLADDNVTMNAVEWLSKLIIPTVVESADELAAAIANGGSIVLGADLSVDADTTMQVAAGKTVNLDLNGNTITAVSDMTGANRNLFDVNGAGAVLTVSNGTINYSHTGANMAWGNSTNVFNVTGGGVLNIKDATIVNAGGSDMAFCVHLNNWGEVTLNADNVVFESTYMAVRAFNSGYDMNNITITNSTLKGNYGLWVHNYTAADFGNDQAKADAAAARLNFDVFNGTNTFNTATAAGRLGFTNSIKLDANGDPIA